jgi:DNA mismatch repair protein MutS2
MDPHALNVLGYGELLDAVGGYAQTPLGHAAVQALRPTAQTEANQPRVALYADVLALLDAGEALPGLSFADPREPLRRVVPEGALLDGPDLLLVRSLLDTAAEAAAFLRRDACRGRPALQPLATHVHPCQPLCADLHRSLDKDGSVLDSASPDLRALRQRAIQLEQALQRNLERLLKDGAFSDAIQESFVTLRNGRFVVPVRREQRGAMPGIIHDHSNSGRTVFVEPAATIPLGNELADVRLQERDEVRRVLAALSAAVRAAAGPLQETLASLVELDAACAVGRWSVAYRCVLPQFGTRLRLFRARHPLLEQQLRLDGRAADMVPLDFDPAAGVRTVVITGSNTGGKTVALKTIGLLTLLAHTGLPVPADPRSEFARFDRVLADIGDEQSLQTSLSTFSAHVRHLTAAFEHTRAGRSLVLLDELGAGTDPIEGGALACAILQQLAARQTFTVATTHLGVVKQFVQDHRQMVNAAVRFSTETLKPEYVLDLGRPGASHALLIARRLRLPEDVLKAAERMLSSDHLRLERVLANMEEDQRRLADSEREARGARDDLVRERDAVRLELEALRKERRKLLHEAYRQAEGIVENARREIENRVRQIREAARQPDAALARAAVARRTIEERSRRLQQGAEETAPRPDRPLRPAGLAPGQRVWVEKLQAQGTILAIGDHGHTARVEVGGLPFTVEVRELGSPRQGADAAPRVTVLRPRPHEAVPTEINLLGLRVDEAIACLDQFLDRAVLAGLHEVRVVHGFGTGRLRAGVHEWLRTNRLIKGFRLGGEKDPGGAGATLVTL